LFRRSDFRNARSVRKVSKREPAKATQEKLSGQNSHRGYESNADEMHPIQTVRKTKMGTLAMHRNENYTFTRP
jgi:hypothetical protein